MKLINVCGARPNFMKIAPLMEAYRAYPSIRPVVVHTGQHYDDNMSRRFFDELGIPRPDVNLDVGSASHAQQTAKIMSRFEPTFGTRPDELGPRWEWLRWRLTPGRAFAASLVCTWAILQLTEVSEFLYFQF